VLAGHVQVRGGSNAASRIRNATDGKRVAEKPTRRSHSDRTELSRAHEGKRPKSQTPHKATVNPNLRRKKRKSLHSPHQTTLARKPHSSGNSLQYGQATGHRREKELLPHCKKSTIDTAPRPQTPRPHPQSARITRTVNRGRKKKHPCKENKARVRLGS